MATKKKASSKAAKPSVAAVPPPAAVVEPDQEPGDLNEDPEMPTLYIGEPFALAGVDADEDGGKGQDGEFLEENEASGVPGCFASVLCGCGQPFKIDLLTQDVKACPGCDSRFTHLLVLGGEGDGRIVGHTWHHILVTNGLMVAEPDEGDEGDEGDEAPAGIPDATT